MNFLKVMLATVLVLDAALVMTAHVVPTTSPVQSVGTATGTGSVAELNGAGLVR
ncbi:MAG TPA: hypothetical protein VIM67_07745 [Terriglobus sp.]